MAVTSFSALMPSVLRLLAGPAGAGVHLAAPAPAPLADWGGCFRTENDVALVLQVLEPLLVLLSICGYGVPLVAMAGGGAAQADVVTVNMPALEIRRGTALPWVVAATAQVGLRVCPTTAQALDLAGPLASFKPGFNAGAGGWLMLPVADADPVTALDDLVRNRLWPALLAKAAAGSAAVGVSVLIEQAGAVKEPANASLPDLVANARLKLNAAGATGLLEAEFDAQEGGPTLGEQMQALAGSAANLLVRVATRGVLVTTAVALWHSWQDEPSAEPADPPPLATVDSLGFVRALLSQVGTVDVADSGSVNTATPTWPLSSLMLYRASPSKASQADWAKSELSRRVKRTAQNTVDVRIAECAFKRDPAWRTFASKTDPYPLYALQPQPTTRLKHTLDFARYWFDFGDEGTSYSRTDATILANLNKPESAALLAQVDAARYKSTGETQAKIDSRRIAAFKLLLARGEPLIRIGWCSALTLLTLGAAGYELEQPFVGANGVPHAYVDAGGWTPVRPYMLLDGQPEASAALGAILQHCNNAALDSIKGLALYMPAGEKASLRDYEGVEESLRKIAKPGTEATGVSVKDEITVYLNKISIPCGYRDPALFEHHGLPTEPWRNYDDSCAVRMAPGAVELMNLGTRVGFERIRPGDIGQRVDAEVIDNKTVYDGKGHAFQVWAVQGRCPADPSGSAALPVVSGSAVDAQGRLLVEIDKDTPTSAFVDAHLELTAYRVIEANLSGSTQGLASSANNGDGGVSISGWTKFPPAASETTFTRFYFARLHESPWSAVNLGQALPASSPSPSPAPAAAPTASPTPAPAPGLSPTPAPATPSTADAFDSAAAERHVTSWLEAYRKITVDGKVITTPYRNTGLDDFGGKYQPARYGNEEDGASMQRDLEANLAANGKGKASGITSGLQRAFDQGWIHADPLVAKKPGEALTAAHIAAYCFLRFGVDCSGFVVQTLLGFPHYAGFLAAEIKAARGTLKAHHDRYYRLMDTNTDKLVLASTELTDPATWRPLDFIVWAGYSETVEGKLEQRQGHVILIQRVDKLSADVWKVSCAESVANKTTHGGPKSSTYFYRKTAGSTGLHWTLTEQAAIAGNFHTTLRAAATVRRAKTGAVS